jgi:hypothetical protein
MSRVIIQCEACDCILKETDIDETEEVSILKISPCEDCVQEAEHSAEWKKEKETKREVYSDLISYLNDKREDI